MSWERVCGGWWGVGGREVSTCRETPGEHPAQAVDWGHFPIFSISGCSFFAFTLVLSAAAKLSCSYSGFSSPRVEWKFTHGDITSLVCYNNKITGELLTSLLPAWAVEGLIDCAWIPGEGYAQVPWPPDRPSWGKERAPCALGAAGTCVS